MTSKINSIFHKFLIIIISLYIISCSSSKEFSEFRDVEGILIEDGIASWYGKEFHGKSTANGETYDKNDFTAAHRTLPFGSIVRVTNSENNKSVIVRINDRGPFAKNRIIDLSQKAAQKIEMISSGSAKVELRLLSKSSNSKMPNDLKVPNYSVQVGSFKNKNEALKVSSEIENSRVEEAFVNGEKYFRIYVGLFTNKDEASKLKDELMNNGIDGFVKQIEN
ncbi:MAG: septal ring lytic transglycosylase RlpA family protein [Ignavibacteriae bacterium]|nr:septal ring lytic transglycosylase RlpA family protein [Ignavibacteriota bacterium]